MKFLKHLLSSIFILTCIFGTIAFAKEDQLETPDSQVDDSIVGGSPSSSSTNNNANNSNNSNTSNVDAIALSIELPGGGSGVSQYASPSLNLYITNKTKQVLSASNLASGFISCIWEDGNINIYQSNTIKQLTIDAGSQLKQTISIKNIFTQSLGDKTISCTIKKWIGEGVGANNIAKLKISVVSASRFDLAISKSIDSIKDNLDAPEIKKGKEGVVDFLMTKVIDILIPLMILVSILTSILGFYKIFFSTDDKSIGTGVKLLAFGAVGIIVMMSAKFFANTIYSDILMSGDIGYGKLQGYEIAQKIYENLLFPFLKIAIYLSLGVLFVMLISRVIGFVFGDDDTKKKAGTIITWNVIGMLIIIGSKQIVEFVYGKQEQVVRSVSNLGDIGSGLLANKNFPFLYEVINRIMGLASLVILIMVLWQAFQLLMKPDAPDAMKKIKNSLLYIFIGIVIIGAGYIITNFLIIN